MGRVKKEDNKVRDFPKEVTKKTRPTLYNIKDDPAPKK
jgi:hypothetical protein